MLLSHLHLSVAMLKIKCCKPHWFWKGVVNSGDWVGTFSGYMIDVVIIHMEAIHTGMMSFVGITIDLATKNLCSTPTISHGPPSAGSQPVQYLYFTSWWYGNYLLTVIFTGYLHCLHRRCKWSQFRLVYCYLPLYYIKDAFRKFIPWLSTPSAVTLLAITNSWSNTAFEMVNGIMTTV